ncbi:MAG: hypothetical protein JXB46_06550 [Candidatus Eisenbacteria bacterium]|nr:hypothetical protein [Candidatus Eisenbacteria bacterium]
MPALQLHTFFFRTLVFSVGSLLVMVIAETVNFNREAWFGVTPVYAPHNFSFNLSFFLPMMLLSVVFAVASPVYYIRSLRALRRDGPRPRAREWATVLPAAPTFAGIVIFVLFVIRVLLVSYQQADSLLA